ncbi:MAG: GNAT family N-acetyltransferase [Immundisolibacter sp.]|uniref:bifunctional acetate--CoA ligase family protein/GNAT family N-acetyltransferase n=1 Tax=Immundisolibacter sp. TaxID=1934948 RepID=UPI003D130EE5
MTIRNLDYLFKPKSVALIGASTRPGSVGAVIARNLFGSGFNGPVMPVNPKYVAVEGVLAYKDVASLPLAPDLAVIATPAHTVPRLIAELGARGTRAAVIISAGFKENGDPRGAVLQQSVLDAAQPHLLRIVGPNCVGIMVPGHGLNASFAHLSPRRGRLAFVAQSGAVITSVIDWAQPRGVGFSHLVSLGDVADVDFGDMLDYLAGDPDTDAILLYMEAVVNARKFMSAARAAARVKPVVVVKAGRSQAAARAAASHTGALAGNDAVYDAVFRRAGMLRVHTLDELFTAAEILATTRLPAGDRLAIVSNGGGIGIMATDALGYMGGHLAQLAPETIAALDKVLPANWSHGNPVDIIGDAPPERYEAALAPLLQDPNVDAVLALHAPVAVADGVEAARAVIRAVKAQPGKTLVTSWVGDQAARAGRLVFSENRIGTCRTPEEAVRAFMYLERYRSGRLALMQTPPSVPEQFEPDAARARYVCQQALADHREWLSADEVAELFAAYHLPLVPPRHADSPAAAAQAAAQIGQPVALKIRSPDILHKTDVGGVALDLPNADAVLRAAEQMLERVASKRPDARIEGFQVEPMLDRSRSHELIVGVAVDPQFGPFVLFGAGGTAVEVLNDTALGLPPLNMRLAHELIGHTRVYELLKGHRGLPGANLDAIALTLIKVAQMAADVNELIELDINPLLASPDGVLAVDVRVRVAAVAEPAVPRLAIRPYPKALETAVVVGDGRELLLRPILPEDEPMLQKSFEQLTPEQVRLRFFVPMKELGHSLAARLTQIDYNREMALILTEHGIPGTTEIFGVVRIAADPDNERAEYAVVVPEHMTGQGLGALLMRQIIDYARTRGIREVWGDVLRENAAMLGLVRKLGFRVKDDPDDPSVVRVTLDLTTPPPR